MQYKEIYFEQESDALKFMDDYWERIVEMNVCTKGADTLNGRYCVLYAKEPVAPNIANVANASGTAKMVVAKTATKRT